MTIYESENVFPNLFGLAVLGAFDGNQDLISFPLGSGDLGVELELESLLGEDPLEALGNLAVDAHTADRGHELDRGDLRLEENICIKVVRFTKSSRLGPSSRALI